MRFIHSGALLLSFVAGRSSAFASTSKSSLSKPNVSRSLPSCSRKNTKMSSTALPSSTTCSTKSLDEISEAYKSLTAKLREVTQLKRVSAVLDYDRMVLMPSSEGAAKSRGMQLSTLAAIIHEKSTEKSIPPLIEQARKDIERIRRTEKDVVYKDEWRVLELTQKSFVKNERIPSDLEAKRAALGSSAYAAWVKARESSDFQVFEPVLEKCFHTAKEIAGCQRGDDASIPLYSQMLDEYEMGMSAERIDELFHEIEDALVPLIASVLKSPNPPSTEPLKGKFDIEIQKKINQNLVTRMGFDSENGRIDESVHPFTMSFGPSDVRITSRYSDKEWFQGMAASIHEAGHAMYEQNVGDSGLDIDSFLSMGAHESQSLFWERHIGMTPEFCNLISEEYKKNMSTNFQYSSQDIYGAINAVSKSMIRVEADELTYPLHVILRYNIERDVVEGKLDVKDIPAKWNELMKNMLDVEITDDAKGCLQDVHWSGLAIGYFPTYLIGSTTAAQLAYYCEQDLPDFRKNIANGYFGDIKEWLVKKVHSHGRRYPSLDDMLEDQLGEKLNPKYFINYLTKKYSDLYNLS